MKKLKEIITLLAAFSICELLLMLPALARIQEGVF